MRFFAKSFYLSKYTYILLGICVALFCFGLLNILFFRIGQFVFFTTWVIVFIEIILLFKQKHIINVSRKPPFKLSNGDKNTVSLSFKNLTNMRFLAEIIEELPEQFQIREWQKSTTISPNEITNFKYIVEPKIRGLYQWRNCHVLSRLTDFSLVYRKDTFELNQEIACYPSFDQFNRLPIKAMVSQFNDSNEKVIQKIGQSLEFEQIKEYATGDDYRHINWKASAKRGHLMVNQYQDERSQDIYCLIDMGRAMKMPFECQTLLDYVINGTLALSKAIIDMQDKAGLIDFAAQKCGLLPAKKDMKQFGKINDALFNIETQFLESDFERLYKFVRLKIKQRSLLVIFTNFDSVNAMHRQLPYLKSLSRHHLLLVVFFENTELSAQAHEQAKDLKEIYTKTIGYNLLIQNKLILQELNRFGIQGLMVKPQKLSLEVINSYLSIKKKSLI
jgi:uncharacterized protein (DUF58 family)